MRKKVKKKAVTIKLVSGPQFVKLVLTPLADSCKRTGVDIDLGGL